MQTNAINATGFAVGQLIEACTGSSIDQVWHAAKVANILPNNRLEITLARGDTLVLHRDKVCFTPAYLRIKAAVGAKCKVMLEEKNPVWVPATVIRFVGQTRIEVFFPQGNYRLKLPLAAVRAVSILWVCALLQPILEQHSNGISRILAAGAAWLY